MRLHISTEFWIITQFTMAFTNFIIKVKDLGRHMLKDLGETQLIYSLLGSDLTIQEFPPLRSLSTHLHNLPVQTTPFLGREKELLEIERLLQMPECRLLTIVGPGGIGKSPLALQVAADMVEIFPHGIFFNSSCAIEFCSVYDISDC